MNGGIQVGTVQKQTKKCQIIRQRILFVDQESIEHFVRNHDHFDILVLTTSSCPVVTESIEN